jgi:hypothetical protein
MKTLRSMHMKSWAILGFDGFAFGTILAASNATLGSTIYFSMFGV